MLEKKNGYIRKIAAWLYDKLFSRFIDRTKEISTMRKLKVLTKEKAEEKMREEYIALIIKILLVLAVAAGLAMAVFLSEMLEQKESDIHLKRADYDGETITYELLTENGKDSEDSENSSETNAFNEKGAVYKDGSLKVEVEPRQYTQKEVEQLFQKGFVYINEQVLGENEDYEHICKPLNLVESIPETPLAVNYWWEEQEFLNADGTLCYEALEEEKQITVYVSLSYEEEVREQSIQMVLMCPEYSEEEKRIAELIKVIRKEEEQTKTKEELVIPKVVNGVELSIEDSGSKKTGVVLLAFLLPVLLWYQHKQKQKQELQQREEQLLQAYPEFVSQLVLYLGAGMTIKACFLHLTQDYQNRKKEGCDDEYLYEECGAMVQELKAGGSEKNCYEAFGKQLGISAYRKLMTLLCQNLSKGSRGLLDLLKQEKEQSFQLQKEYAKKKGEEAGTKLLFPMILLLVVVMVIVMLPAFWEFSM